MIKLTCNTGFVRGMEYLEKYGIQFYVFQGHELYEIQSCSMEKKLLYASIFFINLLKFNIKIEGIPPK